MMISPDRAQLTAAPTNPRDHLAAQGPERENLHAMRTLYHAAVDRADSAAIWSFACSVLDSRYGQRSYGV
jgi:hypothetical protein